MFVISAFYIYYANNKRITFVNKSKAKQKFNIIDFDRCNLKF